MVDLVGLEPTTSSLQGKPSSQLIYKPKYFVVVLHIDLRYERGNEPRGWVFREAPRLAYWRRVRVLPP